MDLLLGDFTDGKIEKLVMLRSECMIMRTRQSCCSRGYTILILYLEMYIMLFRFIYCVVLVRLQEDFLRIF